MSSHDDIDTLLKDGIAIMKLEIDSLKEKQKIESLTKPDMDKLLESLKTLVVIRKDWRIDEKERVLDTKSLSNDELDAAILAAANKIKEQK